MSDSVSNQWFYSTFEIVFMYTWNALREKCRILRISAPVNFVMFTHLWNVLKTQAKWCKTHQSDSCIRNVVLYLENCTNLAKWMILGPWTHIDYIPWSVHIWGDRKYWRKSHVIFKCVQKCTEEQLCSRVNLHVLPPLYIYIYKYFNYMDYLVGCDVST